MILTLEHFQAWLEGQVQFGIALHVDTAFFERYLDQHNAGPAHLEDRLYRLFRKRDQWTADELQDSVRRRIAQKHRKRKIVDERPQTGVECAAD